MAENPKQSKLTISSGQAPRKLLPYLRFKFRTFILAIKRFSSNGIRGESASDAKPETDQLSGRCKGCGDFGGMAAHGLTGEEGFESFRHSSTYDIITQCSKECVSCFITIEAIQALADDSTRPALDSAIVFSAQKVRKVEPSLRIYWNQNSGALIPRRRFRTTRIELYSSSDCPSPWNLVGSKAFRNVEPDSSTDVCTRLARSWIEECCNLHPDCGSGDSPLPTRVLYVGTGQSRPRLHISQGQSAPYVALSYMWGSFRHITTTKATLSDRLGGIPLADIPKTFHDAIAVTRSLGIEYLWIDSLCIIQDDPYDWEVESANMAAVYSHAVVTISADDALNANEGFLGPRDARANFHVSIPYSASSHGGKLPLMGSNGHNTHVYARLSRVGLGGVSDGHVLGDSVITKVTHTGTYQPFESPIDSRGWTFQERLLSPRTLHYAAAEMAFECKEAYRCECMQLPLKGTDARLFKKQGLSADRHGSGSSSEVSGDPGATAFTSYDWMTVVENFTSRNLTFTTDRLPALSGVAAVMQPYGPGDYLCGLWVPTLRADLLWQSRHSLTNDPGGKGGRHIQYYAPSWSWASITSPVLYVSYLQNFSWSNEENSWAEILDIDISKTTANPYGPAQGTIKLRGPLATAAVQDAKSPAQLKLVSRRKQSFGPLLLFHRDVPNPPEVNDGDVVYVLSVTSKQTEGGFDACCLVLLPLEVGSSTSDFKRVGLALTYVQGISRLDWENCFSVREVQVY